MHKLNVDNTVQWELLMLKLSLSIFSVNLETTWSPPNMLVTVLFHLNKNAKVTVIRDRHQDIKLNSYETSCLN